MPLTIDEAIDEVAAIHGMTHGDAEDVLLSLIRDGRVRITSANVPRTAGIFWVNWHDVRREVPNGS